MTHPSPSFRRRAEIKEEQGTGEGRTGRRREGVRGGEREREEERGRERTGGEGGKWDSICAAAPGDKMPIDVDATLGSGGAF